MSDIILTVVLAVAVTCMYIAQRKATPRSGKFTYTLLGCVACVMIAIEAARRDQPNMIVLFSVAALISLASLALDYLKPSNPDA